MHRDGLWGGTAIRDQFPYFFRNPAVVVTIVALVRDHPQDLEARLTDVRAVVYDESGALLTQDGKLSTTSRMALSNHGQKMPSLQIWLGRGTLIAISVM